MDRAAATLTAEQLRRFRDDGFVVVPGVIAPALARAMAARFPDAAPAPGVLVEHLDPAALPGELLDACARVAAACLETHARLAFAQRYAKPPQDPTAAIDWHQDRWFWSTDRPPTVTTWVALDDCDEQNGCLRFAPGARRAEGLLPHVDQGGLATCRAAVDGAPRHTNLSAGGIVTYSDLSVHASGPNRTHQPRRALALGWNRLGV